MKGMVSMDIEQRLTSNGDGINECRPNLGNSSTTCHYCGSNINGKSNRIIHAKKDEVRIAKENCKGYCDYHYCRFVALFTLYVSPGYHFYILSVTNPHYSNGALSKLITYPSKKSDRFHENTFVHSFINKLSGTSKV
jgi:hypothetical protein